MDGRNSPPIPRVFRPYGPITFALQMKVGGEGKGTDHTIHQQGPRPVRHDEGVFHPRHRRLRRLF